MAQSAFVQSWRVDGYNWLSSEPAQVGLQLDGAFRRFAQAVNANPGNETVPLAVVRSHRDATGSTHFGYVWSLGHPVNPVLISYRSITTSNMTHGLNAANVRLECGLASAYDNDAQLHGGYGRFSSTIYGGNAYKELLNGTLYTDGISHPVVLLVYQDTTPGQEYFGYVIKVRQSSSAHTPYDTGLLIYRDPAGHWNSWWYVPYPQRAGYSSDQVARLNGHSYHGVTPYAVKLEAAWPTEGQALVNRLALMPDAAALTALFTRVDGEWRLGHLQPPVLPDVLFGGATLPASGADLPRALNFCRRIESGGRFYELGCKASSYAYRLFDLWLWLPDGLPVDQPAPWQPLSALAEWTAQNKELNVLHTPAFDEAVPVISQEIDYRTVIPPVAWMSLGHHGVQRISSGITGDAPNGNGDSGNGSGSGNGDSGGGHQRPSTGLLWPRPLI